LDDSSTEQPRQKSVPQSEQLLFPIESKETPQGHAPFMDLLLVVEGVRY